VPDDHDHSLSAVQGVFDRFHHERDCRHPQHETQAG
jgi:hypothetical protein